jgi:LysM repeat protein
MPDESIDIKIDLDFSLDIFKNVDINLINNIDIQENKNGEQHSIIIYYVKPGDTIWQIAKNFKSTVADITKINGIEDEKGINIGQQLFIPRYVPEVATGNA